ncbi:MAG TPA: hypothetical protein PKD26_08975 [Pyrinomonadaceae bacterium]|nr:hypothetical protein [Pyrinomonadaceae bacterium]
MKSLITLLFLAFFSLPILAGDPSIWSVSSRADVLKGDARSVSIDSSGAITLAPRISEVFNTEQSFIWSSAADNAGNVYLGTGGEGKVFRVTPAGAGTLFSDLAELNVTALAVGRSGEIFAATSPDGKVYRIDSSGGATVYFDPKAKYIWSLAVMGDGSLAVGTGEGGKIFRVRAANATPESSLFFDSSDSHIICLAVDGAGNLYAGTDSNGLVLKFSADGRPFALLDSPLREIHEIAIGPDGSAYVLALGESASAAAPAPSPTPASESRTVSVAGPAPAAPEQPQKSRHDVTGARSAVYRILPDGGVNVLWSSPSVTGFSIFAQKSGDGALLGTSEKGRIYNISNDGRESLVMQTDASQISTMISRGADLFATTSNQGRLLKIGPETVAEGTYESAVLDAKSVASWGRIWWRSSGNVQIQTRSGNTESPAETWSPWTNGTSETGLSASKVSSPNARYFQWRAVLRTSSVTAALNEVSLAFLPRNIAPEVLSIQVLPTNVGLVANAPVQIDPNIELSGLDPRIFGIPIQAIPPRRVYQRAARSFLWTAEDRNGDKLVYDVQIKEARDTSFKTLRENIAEPFFTLDGLSLPDGRYTLRIIAKDSPNNPAGSFLSGEKLSEPFDIDNTQPTVTAGPPQISGDSARIVFAANDRSSYLSRAEFSINGGPWQTVFAEDGISDSSDERYVVVIPFRTGVEHIVTLRVFDASGNAGSARAVVRQ